MKLMPYHKTVKVWIRSGYMADIDEDIAPVVAYLQTIDGVETRFSCQDSRADSLCLFNNTGGGPYITLTCTPAAKSRIINEFPDYEDNGEWLCISPKIY